jgi:hypothetical protein
MNAEKIAAGLTEVQKIIIRAWPANPFNPRGPVQNHAMRYLLAMGLVEFDRNTFTFEITAPGLEVKAVLEKEKEDERRE